MIDPQQQWCIQIDITNDCTRACSNCTRFVGHHQSPFYMSLDQFEQSINALQDFPQNSPPTEVSVANKVVGIIGGEPLLHPDFSEICCIMRKAIPEKKYRGLWTGLHWRVSKYAKEIEKTFGYVNNNTHSATIIHSPVLVALSDVIQDKEQQRKLVDNCWLQRMWSGSITPKGFFFCEVAAAMDILFNGPGGLPVNPGCWRRPITDFQEQIDSWCYRCGIPLKLLGRPDSDEIDDISPINLEGLRNSPRVLSGKWAQPTELAKDQQPWRYIR